jgi:4-oxalocrotonate tautomerase
MPELVIYLLEGRSVEDKRALVKDVTGAVVKTLGVPQESVTISLVETARTDKGKGGVLFADMKPR